MYMKHNIPATTARTTAADAAIISFRRGLMAMGHQPRLVMRIVDLTDAVTRRFWRPTNSGVRDRVGMVKDLSAHKVQVKQHAPASHAA
jgi:hypothetical protein